MSRTYIHGSMVLDDPSENAFFNITSVKDIRFIIDGVNAFDITSSGASIPTTTITDLTVSNDLTVNNDATVDNDFILGGDMTITGNIITGLSTTIDGRDVATDGSTLDAHIADGDIHFTQSNITQTGALTSGSINWSGNIQTSGNVICNDLTVNGTTTTINSQIVTVDDPIFQLGGDTAPIADDNKDRGIAFRWHNGSSAKNGFFGFNDNNNKFTFIPDASNVGEVISGTVGDVEFGNLDITGNITVSGTVDGRDIDADGTAQDTHIASTSNPHNVSKAQVGLSNVENTALSTWGGSSNIDTVGTITSGSINTIGSIACQGNLTTTSGTINWTNGILGNTSSAEPIFKYSSLGSNNNDFALKQSSIGETTINASSGRNINLSINGSDVLSMNGNGDISNSVGGQSFNVPSSSNYSFKVNGGEIASIDSTGVISCLGLSSTATATMGGVVTGGNITCGGDITCSGNVTIDGNILIDNDAGDAIGEIVANGTEIYFGNENVMSSGINNAAIRQSNTGTTTIGSKNSISFRRFNSEIANMNSTRFKSVKRIEIDDTTDSSSTSTGSLIVDGGVGIAKNLYGINNFVNTSEYFRKMNKYWFSGIEACGTSAFTIDVDTGGSSNHEIATIKVIATGRDNNGSSEGSHIYEITFSKVPNNSGTWTIDHVIRSTASASAPTIALDTTTSSTTRYSIDITPTGGADTTHDIAWSVEHEGTFGITGWCIGVCS